MITAGLGEITSGHNAETRTERLQKNGHEIRKQNDAEKPISELRSAGEIGGPVAGIHVTDRDKITRTGKGQQFAPETALPCDSDRPIDLGQAGRLPFGAPAASSRSAFRH